MCEPQVRTLRKDLSEVIEYLPFFTPHQSFGTLCVNQKIREPGSSSHQDNSNIMRMVVVGRRAEEEEEDHSERGRSKPRGRETRGQGEETDDKTGTRKEFEEGDRQEVNDC